MRIRSGGQTGVDTAALRAARRVGFDWGGVAPLGWKRERDGGPEHRADGTLNGTIPLEFREHWENGRMQGLEMLHHGGYQERTDLNIERSRATIILCESDALTRGSARTRRVCKHIQRPCLVVDIRTADSEHVHEWASRFSVLNVAGPRESNAPGIEKRAEAFLFELFCHDARAGRALSAAAEQV